MFKLLIDIGNTKVAFALGKNGEVKNKKVLATASFKSPNSPIELIQNYLSEVVQDTVISSVSIASVVLELNDSFLDSLSRLLAKPTRLVSVDNCGGLNIKIKQGHSLGADRIANVVALKNLYRLPGVVIDIGSATTIDFVSEDAFIGGVILPGPLAWANSLKSTSSALPLVTPVWPSSVVGDDTVSAINVGLTYGYQDLLLGLINRYKKEMNIQDLALVCTGGAGQIYSEQTKALGLYDPDLTLKGLSYL